MTSAPSATRSRFGLAVGIGLTVALLTWPVSAWAQGDGFQHRAKVSQGLDEKLAAGGGGDTRVIYEGPQSEVDRLAGAYGLSVLKRLTSGAVLSGTNLAIEALALDHGVSTLSEDAKVFGMSVDPAQTTGANLVWRKGGGRGANFAGYVGLGIGVAVIDSGIDGKHPDLKNRMLYQMDFTGEGPADLYGHGTHVAGIIAGSGAGDTTSSGSYLVGMAPGAALLSLKVLSADGTGYVSDVIRAIDWTIANKDRFGIRVVNMSLGTPAFGSPSDDPLAKAAERAVAAGLVVVASAGNFGKLADGTPVVGGVMSPGYAPGVLTVGSLNTQGTLSRGDDVVASYSSRGPVGNPQEQSTWELKPDLVAPGHQIVAAGAVV